MIVRELLTLLGFTVDKASYDKAAKSYDALQGKLTQQQKGAQGAALATQKQGQAAAQAARGTGMLGQALGMMQRFAAQAGLSTMVKGMIEMASNANETSNVLESVFGKDKLKGIEDWSMKSAEAMGRSRFSLQQYASQLGAVLAPVSKTPEEALRMSKAFAELSVDLGSFFNTTDEDAMRALRSGLTGEYESLKRYGVVLNDTTLQEIANQRGIKKKLTQMTIAEKTELRYAAIMQRTKAAQGDAAKTLDGFANSSKAFKESMKEIGTVMGKTVLPYVNKLLKFARDGVHWFSQVTQQSHVLEVAFVALAGIAGVLALEFYGAFIPPALAIGALVLLIDDLWTAMEGGKSVLGEVLGEDSNLLLGLRTLRDEIERFDAIAVWESFVAGAGNAVWAVGELIKKIIKLADYIPVIWAAKTALRAAGVLGPEEEEKSFSQKLAERQAEQGARIGAGAADRAAQRAEREREAKYGPRQYSAVPAYASASPYGFNAVTGTVDAPVGTAPGAGTGMPAPTVNMAPTTIIINGGDVAHVERVVKKVNEDERKKTAAALGGRGRS